MKTQLLPFTSTCCNAELQHHFPCEQYAQCPTCRSCAVCGPSDDFELDVIRETENQKTYRRNSR